MNSLVMKGLFILMVLGQGCSGFRWLQKPVPTSQGTQSAANQVSATSPTTTSLNRGQDEQPGPTAAPTATFDISIREIERSTSTIMPTSVPQGVFTLMVYPPLVLDYDTSLWIDQSQYTNHEMLINYLNAKERESCTIGTQGPSGYFPVPDETIRLGNITYQVTMVENLPSGLTTYYYMDTGSIDEFDYEESGAVKLVVEAKPAEVDGCRSLAEEVLSTLRIP